MKNRNRKLWFDNYERQVYEEWRRKIYAGAYWGKIREVVLQENPFCVACAREGRTTAAIDVDHIRPLSEVYKDDDQRDVYNLDNLQGLCKPCHTRKTLNDIKKKKNKDEK